MCVSTTLKMAYSFRHPPHIENKKVHWKIISSCCHFIMDSLNLCMEIHLLISPQCKQLIVLTHFPLTTIHLFTHNEVKVVGGRAYSIQACMLCFWKGKAPRHFSLVKGTQWGNCKFILENLSKGSKAMTRGHGDNRLRCLSEVWPVFMYGNPLVDPPSSVSNGLY